MSERMPAYLVLLVFLEAEEYHRRICVVRLKNVNERICKDRKWAYYIIRNVNINV